jgi:uncharacterized membrane-anchored protein/membrane protein DedA with SNARE-associated domain
VLLGILTFTGFVQSSGYAAVFVLSVLQSCCVPTSSELTLGFAGVLASEGKLSLPGVIVAGVAGEVVGAYIAWAVGRYGGRPFIQRYGRFVLMTTQDLDRAEGWYRRHDRFGVFGSRLLPVIRNFVAVPAGAAEVPPIKFGILTALGSLLWDGAMALIGYGVGGSYKTIAKGFSDAGYLLGFLAVVAVAVVIWHRYRAYKRQTTDARSAAPARAVHAARRGGPGAPRWGAEGIKVPIRITVVFWTIKLLSTAMGEGLSDALVFGVNKYAAVILGFVAFLIVMAVQLRSPRYNPWSYWGAVAMVAVFGTMAADVLHVVLGLPYLASSLFYLAVLLGVLYVWATMEGTLSIHSIFTPRREVFYWLTVLATFALGTAVGDLTATTFHLGYFGSGVMFIVLFALPGVAYAAFRANSVAMFWIAYILTRPLGASFADWMGFGPSKGGLGLGHPLTALIFAIPIVALVAYVAARGIDTPRRDLRRMPVRRPLAAGAALPAGRRPGSVPPRPRITPGRPQRSGDRHPSRG